MVYFGKIYRQKEYRKSSIKPPGAYLILGTPEGGLLEKGAYSRGGLFKKLDEKDTYGSFISLLPHILQIQHTILGVKYVHSTEFYSKLYQN